MACFISAILFALATAGVLAMVPAMLCKRVAVAPSETLVLSCCAAGDGLGLSLDAACDLPSAMELAGRDVLVLSIFTTILSV